MPDDARCAGLTLIGWLARRMPGEAASTDGVEHARQQIAECNESRIRATLTLVESNHLSVDDGRVDASRTAVHSETQERVHREGHTVMTSRKETRVVVRTIATASPSHSRFNKPEPRGADAEAGATPSPAGAAARPA
jgi:hypothetical protein